MHARLGAGIRAWYHVRHHQSRTYLNQSDYSTQYRTEVTMATVVPFASCYAASGLRHLQLFRSGPGAGYLCLLTYQGPRGAPRPRVAHRGPKMTLRQVCRLLRTMREMRRREGMSTSVRKQATPVTPPGPTVTKATEKKCLPACLRRRRSVTVKKAG